ncbi:MAG: hypothetical protein K2W82_13325 [Candidatus Obscuribacterales bacterium]|nr:hypothetical protein [Candidatus Obscuribacterales bacterium]
MLSQATNLANYRLRKLRGAMLPEAEMVVAIKQWLESEREQKEVPEQCQPCPGRGARFVEEAGL